MAVQPHTVNGHVLQHPTVSLSRLNNAPNERRSPRNISTHEERSENDSLHNSGNQNGTTEEELGNGNNENEQNGYDVSIWILKILWRDYYISFQTEVKCNVLNPTLSYFKISKSFDTI